MLGKVNRIKEISRREKDDLKITDISLSEDYFFVRKIVSRVESVR